MPSFDTSGPITATVDVNLGEVRISAAAPGVAVVDVRPTDTSNKEDVLAAEQTRVEFKGGHLLVKTPKLRAWLPNRDGGSVDVTIELPTGSELRGAGQLADFFVEGELGDARIMTGLGRIELEFAGAVQLKSGSGDISLERASGHAEVTTGTGDLRLRELAGSAVIKNSNGDTWIGTTGGDLRVNASNGSIAIEAAHASVVAKSANGDVRVGEVVRGSARLETRAGDVEVGIREGTAAWLDVNASAGRVHNALEEAGSPEQSDEKVEVRARTTLGDVSIRRAA
jgi:Putative adhesin